MLNAQLHAVAVFELLRVPLNTEQLVYVTYGLCVTDRPRFSNRAARK